MVEKTRVAGREPCATGMKRLLELCSLVRTRRRLAAVDSSLRFLVALAHSKSDAGLREEICIPGIATAAAREEANMS